VGEVSCMESVASMVVAGDVPLVPPLLHAIVGAINTGAYQEAMQGCSALVECYGRREASRAALCVLLSQSLKARANLWSIWRAALPCNSDISCAIRRLEGEASTTCKAPDMAHPQTSSLTDEAFLASSSVAYQRYAML
jgi:hypothetical protein